MFDFHAENIGNEPSSLAIFLHGYNGTIEDHAYIINHLKKHLSNSILIVPEAPEICDKNANKRQWFGLKKYDADDLRYQEDTPTEQIFEIYNRASVEISARSAEINDFVAQMQQKYQISAKNTFLIGFSQGAMLALYSGISAFETYGGIFMLSGLVAGVDELSKNIKSKPSIYLFHGQKDTKVQYKTLSSTSLWLKEHGIDFHTFIYPELAHKVIEDEIIKISEIIKQKTAEK
jgi:phospholipase/carboxylesterase